MADLFFNLLFLFSSKFPLFVYSFSGLNSKINRDDVLGQRFIGSIFRFVMPGR